MRTKYIFLSLVLLGSFLRLYRLPDTMQFLGDQGRDALIARNILFNHHPALIGPVTSIGNMYLGPFYYYFMVLPLMVSYPSPVGPAVAVSLLGIVTVALVYLLGKEMIGSRAALIAMLLYAISPTVIANVRFSWNPNLVPLFSLLLLWTLFKIRQGKDRYWWSVGIWSAVLFQLHYIALIEIGIAGLVWIEALLVQVRRGQIRSQFVSASVLAICIFIISLTPLVLFDINHHWLNTQAFIHFFRPAVASERHFRSFFDVSGIAVSFVSMVARVLVEFFGITAKTIGEKIALLMLFGYLLGKAIFLERVRERKQAIGTLAVAFILSVAFLSLYASSVFDHYLGFVFPMAFLLFGVVLAPLTRSVFLRPLGFGIVLIFGIVSLRQYPGFQRLGGTIFQYQATANAIAAHIAPNDSYNLLAYSPSKDLQAMNVRYFLTAGGHAPADPDDWTSFQKLVVIDEEQRGTPFDESQYVIKLWPNRQVVDTFKVPNGPNVYILER